MSEQNILIKPDLCLYNTGADTGILSEGCGILKLKIMQKRKIEKLSIKSMFLKKKLIRMC